jgi:ferredoxin-NADP reductase
MSTITEVNIQSKLISRRFLTENTYIIRIERKGVEFKAGQYMCLGFPGEEKKEYSIYSAENDECIEFLIKEAHDGELSQKLKTADLGCELELKEPFGQFVLEENPLDFSYVFVGSGTGIAPYHSFVKSHPKLNYEIVHGVKNSREAYDQQDYDLQRYHVCTSKEIGINFAGRVTQFLEMCTISDDHLFYLCGNSDMISDAIEILQKKGVGSDRIRTEIYF